MQRIESNFVRRFHSGVYHPPCPERAELHQQLPSHLYGVCAFHPNTNQNRDQLRVRQCLRAF